MAEVILITMGVMALAVICTLAPVFLLSWSAARAAEYREDGYY